MEEVLVTFQQSLVYLVSIIVNAFFYIKDCLKKFMSISVKQNIVYLRK